MEKQAHRLHPLFYPRSVAVVGAKRATNYRWLRMVLPFSGPKYHVNVDTTEWPGSQDLGFPCYKSLLDIPGEVDYVIVSVPAAVVPGLLEDCIRKKVKGVHLFTAGFAETGLEEGRRLEAQIARRAREAGLLLVGPNCLGVFNPEVGIRFGEDQYGPEGGNLALISQSGGQANGLVAEALYHGLKVSKAISMGNGIVLDSSDYLEYFAQDEKTRVIGLFLEGVRDGRRFFATLREVCRRKPVLVWKVGQTDESQRATAFHSGTVAPPQALWDSAMRQCGAIQVDNSQELIDTARTLLHAPPVSGTRLGLIAISGGNATHMANVFAKAGFQVPPLTEESNRRMREGFDLVGSSYQNPIEGAALRTEEGMARVLDVLNDDAHINVIIQQWSLRLGRLPGMDSSVLDQRLETLCSFRSRARKPYLIVIADGFPQPTPEHLQDYSNRLLKAGIPSFYGFERAAKALQNLVADQRFRLELS